MVCLPQTRGSPTPQRGVGGLRSACQIDLDDDQGRVILDDVVGLVADAKGKLVETVVAKEGDLVTAEIAANRSP